MCTLHEYFYHYSGFILPFKIIAAHQYLELDSACSSLVGYTDILDECDRMMCSKKSLYVHTIQTPIWKDAVGM